MSSHEFQYPEGDKDKSSLIYVKVEGRCDECGATHKLEVDLGQLNINLEGWSREPLPEKALQS